MAISETIKNGEISVNSAVYANDMPYTVIFIYKNRCLSNSDILLLLKDAQPDNFAIGDIVSSDKISVWAQIRVTNTRRV